MKKKTFIVQLLDSKNPSKKSFTQVEDANFYSNDTDASLVFIPHEDSFDFETAKVVMFNLSDESLVERDSVVTTENGRKVASYELPDEVISHWGEWVAQPVFISGGEIYSGAIVSFSVGRHLMQDRPPTLRDIIKVDELYSQLVTVMDEISGKDVISAPEIILARGEHETLGERLDKTTTQLEQTTSQLGQVDNEIVQARGGKATLEARLDDSDAMVSDINVSLRQMYINVKSLGAKGDGTSDDTYFLNYAMQNYTNVWIPDGEYMVNAVNSLRPSDNTTIRLSKGAVIKSIPNDNEYYEIFELAGRKGITISGGKIYGERDEHTGTTGEWGHGINMRGSEDITLENIEVHDCWGDGIYIGILASGQVIPKNIRLKNVVSNNNRRQGMSVVTVDGLYGENVTLSNTNGTLPQAGIDFEPNQATEVLNNIHFVNLRCIDNAGDGVLMHLSQLTNTDYDINMTFDNYYSNGNRVGINFDKFSGEAKGNVVFNQPVVKNSQLRNYGIRAMSKKFSKITFNDPISENPNQSETTSATETADFAFLRTAADYASDTSLMMGNVTINNPKTFWTSPDERVRASTITFSDAITNKLENIEIYNSKETRVTGLELLEKSVYDTGATELVEDYWLGATPSTKSAPHEAIVLNRYIFGQDRTCILQLTDTPSAEYPHDIIVEHNGTLGAFPMYIRPAADERLLPMAYSTGVGKGLMMPANAEGQGSYVRLRRKGGFWRVVEMIGPWEAEV